MQPAPVVVPWMPARSRRRRAVLHPAAKATTGRSLGTRAGLVQGTANARVWLDELASGRMADTRAIALREVCSERHICMALDLAFLSPALAKEAVDGTLVHEAGVVCLTGRPVVR